MAEPPLLAGAEKATLAEAFPRVAVPIAGAVATVTGVTGLEGDEAAPAPTALAAVTVKV